jgi:hypothetical protein
MPILLVLPSETSDQDFQFAIFHAAIHGLGSSISNSYGCFEFDVSPATLRAYDFVISIAALAPRHPSGKAMSLAGQLCQICATLDRLCNCEGGRALQHDICQREHRLERI